MYALASRMHNLSNNTDIIDVPPQQPHLDHREQQDHEDLHYRVNYHLLLQRLEVRLRQFLLHLAYLMQVYLLAIQLHQSFRNTFDLVVVDIGLFYSFQVAFQFM